jgi:phage terminase large subunit-like protein
MPFSQQSADIACNFFETQLKHTADQWFGKPFILAPWQEDALIEIFGRLDDDGNRQIQRVYLEVPKKAGKTEFAAGLILLVLALDPNPGCQVYGAASCREQAKNVYHAACKMVEQNPWLSSKLKILPGTNRILKKKDRDSFYAAIAADGDLTDGVNPSVVVADEVHRWSERKHLENWDVLTKGGITRKESLTIAITTAGVKDKSPLAWRLHEQTERLRDGHGTDPTFYGQLHGADRSDDWEDEKTWIKANPSLVERGGFLPIKKIREQYVSSLTDFESQRSFRRYFLNLWDEVADRCIPMNKWDACKGDWIAKGLQPLLPEDKVRQLPADLTKRFMDHRCWAGVDLSMTTDLTAVSFVFPSEDGFFDVLPFFWIPEEGMRTRTLRDGMPYEQWEKEGFIEASTGDVIDYRDVKSRLEWGSRMFDLQETCFDPWNSRQISVPMSEEGFQCVEIRQGFATLSEANKKFLEIITSGKLRHGGHPILRWNASCLSSKEHNDNLLFTKPERQKDSSRIDGISATVNALTRAMIQETPTEYPLSVL